ncbi:Activating signal cointegrator 1 [Glycine soja]
MRRKHSNSGNYRNPCLTMHQPWASLLVYGIKRVEGRSWPAPITGRLWIHSASKVPEESTIKAMEYFYKEIYALNGISDIQFPQHYPVSRLLGCVEVVGCLTRDELACWEMVPEGVRLEAQTDYCWLCEWPQKLLIPFEMRGYQGVYNLEKKIYEAAVRGLSPVNCPLPVKFPLPDPRNPFSLKPGSISALTSNLKASEVDKSSSISLAIAGAQAAATQFSKKDENSHSTAWNNAPTNMNANNEDTEVARSYNLRSRGRSTEKDNISSTELNMKFGDLTLPSYHKEKSRSNESEGSSKQNRSPGAEADLMISRRFDDKQNRSPGAESVDNWVMDCTSKHTDSCRMVLEMNLCWHPSITDVGISDIHLYNSTSSSPKLVIPIMSCTSISSFYMVRKGCTMLSLSCVTPKDLFHSTPSPSPHCRHFVKPIFAVLNSSSFKKYQQPPPPQLQGPSWILVVGGGKTNLQGMEETLPGGELAITSHPLVPGQSSAVHVKGRNGEPVLVRELDFEAMRARREHQIVRNAFINSGLRGPDLPKQRRKLSPNGNEKIFLNGRQDQGTDP